MDVRSPAADPDEGAEFASLISSCVVARSILVNAAARVPADVPPLLPSGDSPASALVQRGAHLRSLWMWGCETDRRTALRKAAAAALGSGPIEALSSYLESRAAGLLEAERKSNEIDLLADFARPLVRDALMELFGIAPAARASLEAQVVAMTAFIPGSQGGGTARYFALAATARQLEDLWARPLPPLAAASRVLCGAVDSDQLSLDEALAQATLLLFGNSYTTLDALAGLLARLAEQPDLWAAARTGSLPVAALVEEGLRLGPPTHLILYRDAADDIETPGGTIPAGARIALPLDRLNRDPDYFERPDAFDPHRSGPPHLAFGAGRHMCVGLHLARAVLRTGIESLLQRLPSWPPETRISWAPGPLGGSSVSALAIPARALRRC